MKVNRSENRSATENKSNRYNWMIGIMRRLNEKGTTLGLNVTICDLLVDNEFFSVSESCYF